jgi:hypothetical protein
MKRRIALAIMALITVAMAATSAQALLEYRSTYLAVGRASFEPSCCDQPARAPASRRQPPVARALAAALGVSPDVLTREPTPDGHSGKPPASLKPASEPPAPHYV